jgi:hypothetical protein
MKKKIIIAVFFIFIAWAATSCEDLMQCKKCRLVSTNSSTGEVIEDPNETEYCGAQLIAIEATRPVVVGNVTTKHVCR